MTIENNQGVLGHARRQTNPYAHGDNRAGLAQRISEHVATP